jgi:hypothetical protein
MNEPPNLHRDAEAAADMAVNAVLSYLRQSGITGQSEKRQWISKVFDAVRAKELIH